MPLILDLRDFFFSYKKLLKLNNKEAHLEEPKDLKQDDNQYENNQEGCKMKYEIPLNGILGQFSRWKRVTFLTH